MLNDTVLPKEKTNFFFCYNTVSLPNRKSQNLALSSLTHEPNPCNHHFCFANSSCFVNLDVSKLQGDISDGDGYGYGSLSLSFWIFLAIVRLEFWGFSLCLLGLFCLGLLWFLFNYFCLGFCCWMHRMFGGFCSIIFLVMDLLLELSMCLWFKLLCYWNFECVYGGVCFSLL